MRQHEHRIGLIFLIIINLLIIFGCLSISPTKPNDPHAGPYPTGFNELAEKNPLLAHELSKLPEFQDGISDSEAEALDQLCDLYNKDSENFDATFKKMYEMGKPEVRKFCTPLQALFWLAQNDIENTRKQLENYSLESLLWASWNFRESRQNIKYSQKSKHEHRWGDPKEIIDRLNSPELFEFWFARNFSYDLSRGRRIESRILLPHTAEMTIKAKEGVCIDAAHLANTCLKRAGYDATGLNVYFRSRAPNNAFMHSVCIIKVKEVNEDVYYKLGDTNSPGYIAGPYESIKVMAEVVARMHRVALGSFNTGEPVFNRSLYGGN